MEKELSLLEVYNWAIRLKDWIEFKSVIDEFYNETPRSAIDESTYKLVKNNSINRSKKQNERMRKWFEERTGLKDALLIEHMNRIDEMLNVV
tara:strand:- start:106 stop:381 length:276 start_codon:yes stop_codon:yes gene_type:complete